MNSSVTSTQIATALEVLKLERVSPEVRKQAEAVLKTLLSQAE